MLFRSLLPHASILLFEVVQVISDGLRQEPVQVEHLLEELLLSLEEAHLLLSLFRRWALDLTHEHSDCTLTLLKLALHNLQLLVKAQPTVVSFVYLGAATLLRVQVYIVLRLIIVEVAEVNIISMTTAAIHVEIHPREITYV